MMHSLALPLFLVKLCFCSFNFQTRGSSLACPVTVVTKAREGLGFWLVVEVAFIRNEEFPTFPWPQFGPQRTLEGSHAMWSMKIQCAEQQDNTTPKFNILEMMLGKQLSFWQIFRGYVKLPGSRFHFVILHLFFCTAKAPTTPFSSRRLGDFSVSGRVLCRISLSRQGTTHNKKKLDEQSLRAYWPLVSLKKALFKLIKPLFLGGEC